MAFHLGFDPQSAPQHLFVSCGRQNSSEAAPIAEQINRQIPVWYDNDSAAAENGQDEVTQQLAGSRAVVFFADSKLFEGEDVDMCNELSLAKIYSKPCVCVWLADLSNFDVRKLSDGMYNLWLGLKNMKAVNAYDKTSVGETVSAILSAAGVAAPSPLEDTNFPDITASGALSGDSDTFNSLGGNTFDNTPVFTAPAAAAPAAPVTAPVQTAAPAAAPSYAAAPVQTKQKRSSAGKIIVTLVVLILLVLCLLLFTMCSKGMIGTGTSGGGEPLIKPAYVMDVQSADDMDVNDDLKFGTFEGQDIEWIVLDKDGDNLLLLSKNVLTRKTFDDRYVTTQYTQEQVKQLNADHKKVIQLTQEPFSADNPQNYIEKYEFNINWENCSLRKWLNGEFISSAFTSDEQARINQTNIHTADTVVKPLDDGVNMFDSHVFKNGSDTSDKVFLLSIEECDNYFPTLTDRITNKGWWTRSNGYGFGRKEVVVDGIVQNSDHLDDEIVQIVDESGNPFQFSELRNLSNGTYYVCYNGEEAAHEYGVRPALWVNVG